MPVCTVQLYTDIQAKLFQTPLNTLTRTNYRAACSSGKETNCIRDEPCRTLVLAAKRWYAYLQLSTLHLACIWQSGLNPAANLQSYTSATGWHSDCLHDKTSFDSNSTQTPRTPLICMSKTDRAKVTTPSYNNPTLKSCRSNKWMLIELTMQLTMNSTKLPTPLLPSNNMLSIKQQIKFSGIDLAVFFLHSTM